MSNKLAKELLIAALLVIVIMFTIGVLFYDCLPISSERIKSAQYEADSEVKQTLAEVQDNSGVDGSEDNSLLKSYSVDKNDLTSSSSDKSYESGKKDPFAETSEPVEEVVTTTTTGATTNNSQSSNPVNSENQNTTVKNEENNAVSNIVVTNEVNNENTTKEEKSSNTGTFFENKNSK